MTLLSLSSMRHHTRFSVGVVVDFCRMTLAVTRECEATCKCLWQLLLMCTSYGLAAMILLHLTYLIWSPARASMTTVDGCWSLSGGHSYTDMLLLH